MNTLMDPPVYNPSIPFTGYISGGFRPGRMVRIHGKVPMQANGFSISLLTGHNVIVADVGLRLNPRFQDQSTSILILNAKSMSIWGQEEPQLNCPLARGEDFEIKIVCEHQNYKIAINGHHFTQFGHRVPADRITALGIEGEVTVSFFRFEGTNWVSPPSSVIYAPALPLSPLPPQPTFLTPAPTFPAPDLIVPNGGMMAPPPAGLPYHASPIPRSHHPPPLQPGSFAAQIVERNSMPIIGQLSRGVVEAQKEEEADGTRGSYAAGVPGYRGFDDGKSMTKTMKKEKKEMEKYLKEEKKRLKKMGKKS